MPPHEHVRLPKRSGRPPDGVEPALHHLRLVGADSSCRAEIQDERPIRIERMLRAEVLTLSRWSPCEERVPVRRTRREHRLGIEPVQVDGLLSLELVPD